MPSAVNGYKRQHLGCQARRLALVGRQHDVAAAQVAMHDIAAVQVGHGGCDLRRDRQHHTEIGYIVLRCLCSCAALRLLRRAGEVAALDSRLQAQQRTLRHRHLTHDSRGCNIAGGGSIPRQLDRLSGLVVTTQL